MPKLWLVALYDYKRHALKPSFILVVLSLPLAIMLMIGLIWLADSLYSDTKAVGYVDHSGLLQTPVAAPRPGSSPDEPSVPDSVPMTPFSSDQAANQALLDGEIQAYYVIARDYDETRRVDLVYLSAPDGDVTRQFRDFLQINRLDDLPPDVARRAVAGSNLVARWPDDSPYGGREFSQRTFVNQFLPLFVGLAFVILLFMSSGYLVGTLSEEKGQRIVEVLFTSLAPSHLIGGKILAVVAVSFTQLLAWILFAGFAVFVGGDLLGLDALRNLSLDLRMVAPLVLVFVPAYVMFAGLMTAAGATFADAQEAQSIVGICVFLSMIPVWLIQPIIEHPGSPLAIGLSLFPTTALPTLSMRVAFGNVPSWQIIASVAILILCAAGAVWLAGRAFRLGMLRYGQNLDWRELIAGSE
jgi:ABC-2 type transport system permease protein